MTERDYVLGTHDEEIARLGLQHRVWRPTVLECWQRAGISRGNKVVDVGAGPGFASNGVGRTLVSADVDNDGDLDLLVTSNGGVPELLRNGNTRGNALVVRLAGVRSNREGIGARVLATAGGRTQVREVKSGSSYLGQNDLRAHFGLGEVARVDRVQVRWPAGTTDTVEAPPLNHGITIVEGRGMTASAPFAPGSAR